MNTLELLCSIKASLPNNYLFFAIFIIIKSRGSLMLSISNKSPSQKDNLYCSIVRFFLHFRSFDSYISLIDYNIICYIIYFVILFVFMLIILGKFMKSQSYGRVILKQTRLNNSNRALIRVLSFCITVLAFLSDYFIEILSLPISIFLVDLNIVSGFKSEYIAKLAAIRSSLFVSYYFYLVINLIFIVLLNVLVFFYMKLINNIHLSNKKIIAFSSFNSIIVLYVIMQNLVILQYYFFMFQDQRICAIVLNTISAIYCLIALMTNIFLISTDTFCNLVINGVYIYCLSGSIISLMFNCTNAATDDSTGQHIFFLFIFQVLATGISLVIINFSKKAIFDNKLPSILFKQNHISSYDYISEFMILLKKSFKEIYYFSHFLSILLKHQDNCQNNNCDCSIIDVNEMKNLLKGSKTRISHDPCTLSSTFEKVILIIENNIINYISSLANNNKLCQNLHIIVYHCCFSYYFKENHIHTLYLIEEYMSSISYVSFEYRVYLSILKQKVIKHYYKKKIKQKKDSSFMVRAERFVDYFDRIISIHLYLTHACLFFSQILNSKRVLSSSKDKTEAGKDKHYNSSEYIRLLFSNCEKLNRNIRNLTKTLTDYKEDETFPLKNPQMCYLITHFFNIIYKKVPIELQKTFCFISSYEQVQKHPSFFSEVKFNQPMIISIQPASQVDHQNYNQLRKRHSFTIEYASPQIISTLGYEKDEVIKHDMHELLPDFLAEKHADLIQRQIFLHKIIQAEVAIFILNKKKYFEEAHCKVALLPTINNNILFICDVKLINHPAENASPVFKFVLDINSNIMSFTESFASQYHLTYDLIKKYNISFSTLFGISNDKMVSAFGDRIDLIKNVDTFSLERYLNIISTCKLKDFIDMTIQNKRIVLLPEDKSSFKFSKDKKDVKRNIALTLKEIENTEIDMCTMNLLKELKCILNNETHFENNATFSFDVSLRHMGNYPFFFVTVIDNDISSQFTKIMRRTDLQYKACEVMRLNNENVTLTTHSSMRKISLWKTALSDSQLFRASFINDTTDVINHQSSLLLPLQERGKGEQSPQFHQLRRRGTLETITMISNNCKNIIDLNSIQISIFDKVKLYTLYFFLLVVVSFYFYQTFDRLSQYDSLEGVSAINTNVILLKQMFYDTASYYTSLCFREDKIEVDTAFDITVTDDNLLEQLALNSQSMFNYLNLLAKSIHQVQFNEKGKKMLSMFYKEVPYYRLRKSWDIDALLISLETELMFLHFHMSVVSKNEVTQCRVKEKFFNASFNKETMRIDDKEEVSQDESMLFDLIVNGLPTVSKTIDLLIVEATKMQRSIRTTALSHFELISIIFNCLMILTILLYFFLIFSFHKKIKSLLKIFLSKSYRIAHVELKINLLLGMLNSFDEEICTSFESTLLQQGDEAKKDGKVPMTISNQRSSSTVNHLKEGKPCNLRGNTELDSDSNKNITIQLPLLIITYAFIVIYLIAFAIVSFGCLIFDMNNLNYLKLTNEIGRIYLSTVPRFNEIIMYYKYSILLNDTRYCELNQSDYQYYDYTSSEYFSSNVNYQNDTKFAKLGNSKMAFLMKKHIEDIEILNKYNRNAELKVLPLARDFQNEVSCNSMIEAFVECCSHNIPQHLIHTLIDDCKNFNNGMIYLGGLQLNLENAAISIFDLYIDFVTGNRSDIEGFLAHPDYLIGLFLMQNIFVYKLDATGKLVIRDFLNFFASIKSISWIFLILMAALIVAIAFSFLAVFYPKILSFFNSFKGIVQKIEIALMDGSSYD